MRTNRSIQLQNCQMSLSAQHDQRSSIRHSAIQYGHNGWKVLPCIPTGNKNKAPLLTHGFKDASSNPAVITSWWGSFPDALIGLAVPVGLVVLDIDPRDGGSLGELEELAGGSLPDTLVAESGRGDGGRHYWFSTQERNLKHSSLPQGIDLREGGKSYVIAPPSLHPSTGRPYRWVSEHDICALPALIERKLIRRALSYRARMAPRTAVPGLGRRGSVSVPRILNRLGQAGEGSRNNVLFEQACRMVDRENRGLPADWVSLASVARAIGLDDAEIETAFESARKQVR